MSLTFNRRGEFCNSQRLDIQRVICYVTENRAKNGISESFLEKSQHFVSTPRVKINIHADKY